MKRLGLQGLGLLLLGGLLAACSMGGTASGPTGGGRPELPSVSRVSFPAPLGGEHLYLRLQDEHGTSVYQVGVPGSAREVSIRPGDWMVRQDSLTLHPLSELLPEGATDLQLDSPDAQVALLEWVVWRDSNANSVLDPGEALDLMTHDRVVYASGPGSARFTTAGPDLRQTWTLTAGWSRAEHYVYRPNAGGPFLRSFQSTASYVFSLHEPTPENSM